MAVRKKDKKKINEVQKKEDGKVTTWIVAISGLIAAIAALVSAIATLVMALN